MESKKKSPFHPKNLAINLAAGGSAGKFNIYFLKDKCF